MANKRSKRSITRENLEYHGIYYDDEGSGILPAHVCIVRDMLLSFEGIAPEGRWKETLRKEELKVGLENVWDEALHPPDTAWVQVEDYEADLTLKSIRWQTAHNNMVSCFEVAKEAQLRDKDAEDGWMLFWRMSTFIRVSERASDQPGFQ